MATPRDRIRLEIARLVIVACALSAPGLLFSGPAPGGGFGFNPNGTPSGAQPGLGGAVPGNRPGIGGGAPGALPGGGGFPGGGMPNGVGGSAGGGFPGGGAPGGIPGAGGGMPNGVGGGFPGGGAPGVRPGLGGGGGFPGAQPGLGGVSTPTNPFNKPTIPPLPNRNPVQISKVLELLRAKVPKFKENAAKGDPKAQFNLGVFYTQGVVVPLDFREGFKWYLMSAQQGFAVGQFNTGIAYAIGQGVEKDRVQSYKWWNLAASQGFDGAAAARDSIAKYLTRPQIADAQRMCRGFEIELAYQNQIKQLRAARTQINQKPDNTASSQPPDDSDTEPTTPEPTTPEPTIPTIPNLPLPGNSGVENPTPSSNGVPTIPSPPPAGTPTPPAVPLPAIP